MGGTSYIRLWEHGIWAGLEGQIEFWYMYWRGLDISGTRNSSMESHEWEYLSKPLQGI